MDEREDNGDKDELVGSRDSGGIEQASWDVISLEHDSQGDSKDLSLFFYVRSTRGKEMSNYKIHYEIIDQEANESDPQQWSFIACGRDDVKLFTTDFESVTCKQCRDKATHREQGK